VLRRTETIEEGTKETVEYPVGAFIAPEVIDLAANLVFLLKLE